MSQPNFKNVFIAILNAYIELVQTTGSIIYTRNNLDIIISPESLKFTANFKSGNDDFKVYRANGISKHIQSITNYTIKPAEAEEIVKLLSYEYPTVGDWVYTLVKCYSIFYTHGKKKILRLYKNRNIDDINIPIPATPIDKFAEMRYNYLKINSTGENCDIRGLTIDLDVDELHYWSDSNDEYLNLPIMRMKKFYNNGMPIDIPDTDFWIKYKSIKPCYTFQNKYIISCEPDYNNYINDNFGSSTPTGYFYRLDGKTLIILSYKNQNWPLTFETGSELLKLAKEVVFIPNNLESIRTDLREIKKILPVETISVRFDY